MEFFAGIITTIVVGFIGYKAYSMYKRRKETRDAYIPPRPGGPRKDYLDNSQR